MPKPLRALHVEDSERDANLLTRHLSRAGYELTSERVETAEAMRRSLKKQGWDVILCDYSMPHFDALQAVRLLKEMELDLPFIIISGTVGEAVAVEAMRAGAHDYLMKDNLVRLVPTIERELQEAENRRARRQAEAELRQSEEQYRRLIDTAYEGIWIADANAQITYANQRLAKMLGYTVEELIGRPVFEYLAGDTHGKMKIKSQRRLQGIEEQCDMRLRRKDGSALWVILSATAIRDGQGQVTSTLAMLTDITKRKRGEEEKAQLTAQIESQRQRLNNIVASVPGVVWESWKEPDAAGQRSDFVSDYVVTMLGYSVEEWLAKPNFWVSIVHPDDREEVANGVAASFASGKSSSQKFRWVARDGRIVWVESNYAVVADVEGRPAGLRGVTLDVTERIKLEEQLRQAEKMEAIGTLAGGIAHDFNNILGAIVGYTELAELEVTEGGRAHNHLEQVLIASARAADLVRQILTFSRQKEHDREALQLQPIINETLMLLQGSLPSTIEVVQNIDPAASAVLGDSTQIQQVIMNLCTNAGQAMEEHGGVLEISLTRLDIDSQFAGDHPELKEGPHIRLTVSDTGCGMDRATRERIFEPFFTTKAPGHGTGLGLAVVHGVIKNHGGMITVDSQPGLGSSFNIYLPVYDDQPDAVVHKSVPTPRGNGEHILFVDDEDALVSLGKSTLEDLGYRVTTRTDGVEALAAFKLDPEDFDLVITDQTMPHMNGSDLSRELLQIRPGLPVILATGYSATMSPEKAKAIGIREFLFKPNTMHELGEAIRRALG